MKLKNDPEGMQSVSGRLIFVITMLLVVMMAARTPLDSDLWWHLRAGQVTVETGKPLISDIFSFTRGGQTWVNHSWLSQVMLFGLFQLGSTTGLTIWVTVLAVISLALVYIQMQGPAWWRALLVILAAVTIAPVWSPRPQMASLMLFAGLGWWLGRWKTGEVRSLWILPILFLVWSNLHGGYSLGFLLLGVFVVGQAFNHILGFQEESLPWRTLGRISLWSGLAFLAVAINPNGLEMWRIPFQTVGMNSLQQFIQEWASPDFHDPTQQPILLIFILLLGAFGFSGRKMNAVDWLTAAGFLALALVSRRNIAPFALAAIPILSSYGWSGVQGWLGRVSLTERFPSLANRREASRPHPGINLLLAGVIGLVAFAKLGVVSLPAVVQSAEASVFPQAAVKWIRDHPDDGRTLSEYGWGGYLTWYLPEDPVFVDGRTDLFGDEIVTEWRQVVQAEQSMVEILNRWKIDRVMLMPDRPAASVLVDLGWIKVYEDQVSVILENRLK